MGKTVTSYPPTRGENSLRASKGQSCPGGLSLVCGLGKPNRERQEKQAAEIRHASRQQRGRGGARTLSRVFPLLRSAGGQTSGPRFAVMTSSKLGRGGAVGWPQAQRCQEFPELSRVSRFPFWASIPSEQKRNRDPSPLCLHSLGRRRKQRGPQINTRRSRPASR